MLYAGIWGAVSTWHDSWNRFKKMATVVCRQLGYQAGTTGHNLVFGKVNGPVWITNLRCSGSEADLMSCSHDGIGNNTKLKRRSNDASVICWNGSLPSGNVNLKVFVILIKVYMT